MAYYSKNMHIVIEENGCRDPEVKILDTRIPYFCNQVRELFAVVPDKIQIVLMRSKDQFEQVAGDKAKRGAITKENVLYIYQPHLFGEATPIHRKNFYRLLCQEVVYIFYKTNRQALN